MRRSPGEPSPDETAQMSKPRGFVRPSCNPRADLMSRAGLPTETDSAFNTHWVQVDPSHAVHGGRVPLRLHPAVLGVLPVALPLRPLRRAGPQVGPRAHPVQPRHGPGSYRSDSTHLPKRRLSLSCQPSVHPLLPVVLPFLDHTAVSESFQPSRKDGDIPLGVERLSGDTHLTSALGATTDSSALPFSMRSSCCTSSRCRRGSCARCRQAGAPARWSTV